MTKAVVVVKGSMTARVRLAFFLLPSMAMATPAIRQQRMHNARTSSQGQAPLEDPEDSDVPELPDPESELPSCVHVKVAGASSPFEQDSLATEGVQPVVHEEEHSLPFEMMVPSLQADESVLLIPFGAEHEPGARSHLKELGVSTPLAQSSFVTSALYPSLHCGVQTPPLAIASP